MLFLWAALPAICLLTALVRRTRLQNALLLLISLLFYAWGDPDHLVLLLGLIAVNYLLGLALERTGAGAGGAANRGAARAVQVLAVLCNLGVLGVFKYADFVLGAADRLLPGGFASPVWERGGWRTGSHRAEPVLCSRSEFLSLPFRR